MVILMDSVSNESWQKIKDHMESVGKTDNFYYKRAVAILQGKKDPLAQILQKPEEHQ